MTTNEQAGKEEVPPGIVAFKQKSGRVDRIDTDNYRRWVSDYLNDPEPTIHTISVDGKEWSVGEWIIFRGRQEQIISFEFSEGHQWKVKLKAFDDDLRFAIQAISKLPTPPQQARESESALYEKFRSALDIHDMRAGDNPFIMKCITIVNDERAKWQASLSGSGEETVSDVELDKIAAMSVANDRYNEIQQLKAEIASIKANTGIASNKLRPVYELIKEYMQPGCFLTNMEYTDWFERLEKAVFKYERSLPETDSNIK